MSLRVKFYRAEADRFRAIAATSRDPVFAERYRQLAKDSIEVAEAFEAMHVLNPRVDRLSAIDPRPILSSMLAWPEVRSNNVNEWGWVRRTRATHCIMLAASTAAAAGEFLRKGPGIVLIVGLKSSE